jgi:beta-glucosidase
MHHLLLGHGMAVDAMRSTARRDERFAIALNLVPMLAASDSAADLAAARKVDGMQNRAFLDPILRGGYPADVIEATRDISDWGFVHPGDAETIATPIDLLGVNYYFPLRVAAAPDDSGDSEYPGTTGVQVLPPEGPTTDMGWEVRPAALTELLGRLQREYGVPMLITENGAAYPDVPEADGTVRDPLRVAYLEGHITAMLEAITAGADVRGYFAWSLMDNFEWAHGYARRFGLFRVDYTTLARHWKDSAHWYGQVARSNGLP